MLIASIRSADILRLSHYDVPEGLIEKLDQDETLQHFHFYRYDQHILNYYLECHKAGCFECLEFSISN